MSSYRSIRRTLVVTAALAGVLVTGACSSDGETGGMKHDSAPAPTAQAASFNDADVEFAQMMIPHHQQAVEMAELAATQAADAEVKKIAAQIKAAQDPEVATMTAWLKAWGKPTAPSGGHGGHAMPGMMSDSDMAALKAAKGKEFDKKFVQLMIAHHEGAIEMAKAEQANGTNAEAKALAKQVADSQQAEVETLKKLLARL